MRYSKIFGTGSYLPEKVLSNFDLEKIVDTSNDWIVERTGIHNRHISGSHETSLFMAEQAALKALEASGLKNPDIGLIIVATTTPESMFPSTACMLQEKLGLSSIPAFDLNSTACAGFMYALSIADMYIKSGSVDHALVIGSEVMSKIVDWSDRSTCILFGDGAGAVLLGPSSEPGVYSTHLHADGNYKDVLSLDANVGKSIDVEKNLYIKMKGNQLFKLAVNVLGKLFDETLSANNMNKSDVDWLVPHQANIRIIEAMAKKLSLPIDRVAITLADQGNTSSASIPLALDKAISEGKIKRDDLLMLEGIGGGLVWGSALIKY
ncbi:ketoacyl-ACP synthase III [Gammaproteobacteria bacterium]|nr:ketoacyl-ACP synthase III [Gammaproteobacteria bacterium]